MSIPPVMIEPAKLRPFAAALLAAAGAREEEARLVAESLVESNQRGHDSHGVMRIIEYTEQLASGALAAGAEFLVRRETASMIAADARFGFGQVQCRRLIDRMIPKARELGVACGTMVRCGHVGRLGEWVEFVGTQGMASLMTVNDNGVLRCVAPPGGTQPRISTNPLAIGVPRGEGPLVFDMSTSVVANGKVRVAKLAGQQCPEGWLLDANGMPTTDPATRFAEPPGTILPLGGDQSHKGFGLGLLLDMLVGGLSGGFCPPAPEDAHLTNNVLLIIWNPEGFAGRGHFAEQVAGLEQFVRSTQRRSGVEAIRLPGDRSAATRQARSTAIPLDPGTWQALTALAAKRDVPLPSRSQAAKR